MTRLAHARLLTLALVLSLAACGNSGVAQVGPTLPDVTWDGRLEVNGRVVNVLEQSIASATATLTILHVSGATYVETAELLAEDGEPLAYGKKERGYDHPHFIAQGAQA